jgi:hypothetical protein
LSWRWFDIQVTVVSWALARRTWTTGRPAKLNPTLIAPAALKRERRETDELERFIDISFDRLINAETMAG